MTTTSISGERPVFWERTIPCIAICLLTFFFLLGTRSLNEPDEGRYAEIAREMLAGGDWLVPHLWHVPHMDKPPLAYWAVAVSMRLFGQNEWAVRLPLALAGLSGVAAAFCLGRALGGRRAGIWSALILQSAVLYFAMARMLTVDMFLTQFLAWAGFCFWKSWGRIEPAGAQSIGGFIGWHAAGWLAISLGFLAKGPIAVAVPLAAWLALIIARRKEVNRFGWLCAGLAAGVMVFCVVALPWYLRVFDAVPGSFEFMTQGQVAGHALGTAVKNRSANPFYFVGILAFGFLPWSLLPGWLWRRSFWRELPPAQRTGWIFLLAWVLFTFGIFTLSSAKRPAYILPLFPPLAVLIALRFFSDASAGKSPLPVWIGRGLAASAALVAMAFPIGVLAAFHRTDLLWPWLQIGGALVAGALLVWRAGKWNFAQCAASCLSVSVTGFCLLAATIPSVETSLRANQTLKPLGAALLKEYQPGNVLICWGQLPQGLPFYAQPALNPARVYLGGMATNQVPFEFPGNLARFGAHYLPDDAALERQLAGTNRVLVAAFQGTFEALQARLPRQSLRRITTIGRWDLFTNR